MASSPRLPSSSAPCVDVVGRYIRHLGVDALGSYIRVVGGVIIADAHFLTAYIRGVTTVFSIFLALEAALERKTIDPEFSLLSLPLIPLEIATGVTKKLYSWIPSEISASISKGLETAGITFLTKVSEDVDIHPTTRIVARMVLHGTGSISSSSTSCSSSLPITSPSSSSHSPKSRDHSKPFLSLNEIEDKSASVVILKRIVDEHPQHLTRHPLPPRPSPEGAAMELVIMEAAKVSSPTNSLHRASSSSTKGSSSSSRKLTKEEEDLLAAFPTPSTSRGSSRTASISSDGICVVEEDFVVDVDAVREDDARNLDGGDFQTSSSDVDMLELEFSEEDIHVCEADDPSSEGEEDPIMDATLFESASVADEEAGRNDLNCASSSAQDVENPTSINERFLLQDENDDDDAFAEGLRLQLELESVQLESSLPLFEDAIYDEVSCNDLISFADNYDQLRRVDSILDKMNVYYYVLTQLETAKEGAGQDNDNKQQSRPASPSPASEMPASMISPSPPLMEVNKKLFSSTSSLDNISTPTSISGFSATNSSSSAASSSSRFSATKAASAMLTGAWAEIDASDADSRSVASSAASASNSLRRRQQQQLQQQQQTPRRRRRQNRRLSNVSLASLSGLEWDNYAPNRYSESEARPDPSEVGVSAIPNSQSAPFLIEPFSFVDDGEFFDEQLPLGLQELERTTQMTRANAILNEYLDEPVLDGEGEDAGVGGGVGASDALYDKSDSVVMTDNNYVENKATSANVSRGSDKDNDETDDNEEATKTKADASFFSSFLSSSISGGRGRGGWSLPKTPDVVRRIIEGPTPKISRKFNGSTTTITSMTATSTATPSSPHLPPRQRTWPITMTTSLTYVDDDDDDDDEVTTMNDKKSKYRRSAPYDLGSSSFDKEDAASSMASRDWSKASSMASSISSSSSISASRKHRHQQQYPNLQPPSSHKRRRNNHHHHQSSPVASAGIPGSKKFGSSEKTHTTSTSSSSSSNTKSSKRSSHQ